LAELLENNLLVRYGKNGEYGYVRNFIKHQYINPREGASVIPAPDQIDTELGRENIGYVYAFLSPLAKRVKVGMTTKQPDARAKDLQAPEELQLIFSAKVKDPKKTETEIHRRLEKYRKFGEWFEWCTEVEKVLMAYSSVLKSNDASARVGDALARGTGEGKGMEGKGMDKERLESSLNYLKNIPTTDLFEFYQRFDASKKGIMSKAESLYLYCQGHGKKYRDYKAMLLNALKKDFPERAKDDKIRTSKLVEVEGVMKIMPKEMQDEAVALADKMKIKNNA
jgi:hypothetical protein